MKTEKIPACVGRYLGDGVYASFDGFAIVLDLRQLDDSRIALESEVLDALIEYATACGMVE